MQTDLDTPPIEARLAAATPKRLRSIWGQMKRRCGNKNDYNYRRYGARGISVCEEWMDFSAFAVWSLKNGYSNNLSIDRIDNDGNYEPGNCRWTTPRVQANNRRTSHVLSFNGETKTVAEWADVLGVPQYRLYNRLYDGWDDNKTLSTPIPYDSRRKVIDTNGVVYMSVSDAARSMGVSNSLITMVCKRKKKTARGVVFSYV